MELHSCCVGGNQCFSLCVVSGGIDPDCFGRCHDFYCPVCDPLSSSSVYDSDSLSFAAVAQSLDVLSYVVIAACVLFSFLLGFSGGRK